MPEIPLRWLHVFERDVVIPVVWLVLCWALQRREVGFILIGYIQIP